MRTRDSGMHDGCQLVGHRDLRFMSAKSVYGIYPCVLIC